MIILGAMLILLGLFFVTTGMLLNPMVIWQDWRGRGREVSRYKNEMGILGYFKRNDRAGTKEGATARSA